MQEAPSNIQEFNTIAAIIFAQLYEAHPIPAEIDKEAVAIGMGLGDAEGVLPSGRSFRDVFAHTNRWLSTQGFIDSMGMNTIRAYLTEKGLRALNTVSAESKLSFGDKLKTVPEGEDRLPYLSRVVGNFFGGLFGMN